MEYIMAKIGSVTRASMLKKILEKQGIDSYVVHTPPEMNKGGCSYSLKFNKSVLDTVIQNAMNNRIKIKGIYADKGGEYYDIS